jgi:hypothetical protein
MSGVGRGIIVLAIVLLAGLYANTVHGANEYLNGMSSTCETARIEFYSEVGKSDSDYSNGDDNDFTSDRGTLGVRLTVPLGSPCTDEMKEIMLDNEKLKQELEMLKMCARYKDLELGPNFATVREMCKDVKSNPKKTTTNN